MVLLTWSTLLAASCANEEPETPDYCKILFSYWGVESRECKGACDLKNSVTIVRRNNVVVNGQDALGSTHGYFIEIDKSLPPAAQLSVALHELGHVLLGPTHSDDPTDLMFPYLENDTWRSPSAREFFLASELHAGAFFQCRFIP